MDAGSARLSRRRFCQAAVGAAALAGCGRRTAQPPAGQTAADSGGGALSGLQWAVAGDWRSEADRARDGWRHPAQSLSFWGLRPGMTVVEFWPGAGWYSDIIAPYLKRNGGKLISAQFQAGASGEPAEAAIMQAYRRKFLGRPSLYGQPSLSAFGPRSGPVAPAASADLVLFLRNLHDWMAAGIADKAFRDAYAALKPGGVLGIEEHRAAPDDIPDPLASDGYVQESYVKQLAMDAGFRFDGASEINANPKDDHHHPFGVWTLPPTRQSSLKGPPDPAFDHSKYDAIGESDRMTLRFVRPQ
jgi:predicted methyltransferase